MLYIYGKHISEFGAFFYRYFGGIVHKMIGSVHNDDRDAEDDAL